MEREDGGDIEVGKKMMQGARYRMQDYTPILPFPLVKGKELKEKKKARIHLFWFNVTKLLSRFVRSALPQVLDYHVEYGNDNETQESGDYHTAEDRSSQRMTAVSART